MGERKGTNHYYPPDYDPRKGSLNSFLGTHALRERARKIHLGILIIRFEMPYNIWCEGCNNHIGMGVRYNAEKKKIGMYYTTPVYQFRMKCHLCNNHFEIKTDPGNLDYVIVSGARRQENRWDPFQNEQVVPEDKDTQKRLFDDAMFKLEHGSKDESTAKKVAPVLGKLVNRNEQTWKDDFAANQALRASFRAKKKEAISQEHKDADLLRRSSLNIKLLPENEEDIRMASLLALAPSKTLIENQDQARVNIMNRPALSGCTPRAAGFLGTRAARHIEDREESRKKLKIAVRPKFGGSKRSTSSLSSTDGRSCSSSSADSTVSSDGGHVVMSPSVSDLPGRDLPLQDVGGNDSESKIKVEDDHEPVLPVTVAPVIEVKGEEKCNDLLKDEKMDGGCVRLLNFKDTSTRSISLVSEEYGSSSLNLRLNGSGSSISSASGEYGSSSAPSMSLVSGEYESSDSDTS